MFDESENIIQISNLHKYFDGTEVLNGINLNVNKGELISIIGRSGCGKTTLLRCLNCLEIFDEGTIRIAGITLTREKSDSNGRRKNNKSIDKARKYLPFLADSTEKTLDEDFQNKAHAVRERVGMLFQSLNLFPHLSVLDNVAKAPMIVQNMNRDEAFEISKQLLEKVGLSSFISRYPHQLSGGQAQRVAIARALAMQPQVMLYDEPTSALDPELVEDVLQVMKNLHNEGMTQLIVTHAMGFAKSASDFVIYMDAGEIIEIDKPDKIFLDPKDERTRQYVNILSEK